MKKIIALICMTVLVCSALCGCSDIVLGGRNGIQYDNRASGFGSNYSYSTYPEDGFASDDATLSGNIERLEIDWVAGNINISYHDEDTIELKETANRTVTDAERFRYKLSNGVLTVKYCQSGIIIIDNLSKTLELTLPKGTELKSADIDVVSADLAFDGMTADRISFDSTSGNMSCNTVVCGDLKVNTVSGDLFVDSMLKAKTFETDTVSGNVRVADSELSKKIDFNSVSGDLEIGLSQMCAVDSDTTSGNVILTVPRDASFTLDFDSVSGDISCDLPAKLSKSGCVAGSGEYDVGVNSVSGDITILVR